MTGSQLGTTDLHDLLQRSRAGDAAARQTLAQSVYARLEQLARQMLRRFLAVRRREDTGDILNNAMLRFLNALEEATVHDSKHFYALAATQIRRELIDLARRYRTEQEKPAEPADPAQLTADWPQFDDLERWCAFHEAVQHLPDDERTVFEAIFYHDVSQRDLAEQLEVHPKTIQRRYRAACVRLYERLAGRLPEA